MRLAIFVLATSALLAGCKEQATTPAVADYGRPVLVHRVAYEDRVPERRLVATIRPRVEVDLGFRIGGKVAARLVDVGDKVSAGQALGRLDEIDFQLQREQAVAERDAATASLSQAQADLRRTTTLNGEGWAATSVADRQKAATEEARGRLLRAERALTLGRKRLHLRRAAGRRRRRRHGDRGRARAGRQRRTAGDPRWPIRPRRKPRSRSRRT